LVHKGWNVGREVACYDPSNETRTGKVDLVAYKAFEQGGQNLHKRVWAEHFSIELWKGLRRIDLRELDNDIRRAELAQEHPMEAGIPDVLYLCVKNYSDIPVLQRHYSLVLAERPKRHGLPSLPKVEVRLTCFRELGYNPDVP